MPNKKTIVCACLLALAAASLGAADYSRPNSSEVVIVARVVLTPDLNEEFFAAYRKCRARNSVSYMKVGPTNYGAILVDSMWQELQGDTDLGEFVSFKTKIGTDRRVGISRFVVYPARNGLFEIVLPVFMDVVVPDGANYVYIGTFVYEWKGSQFEIKSVKRLDELAEARGIVAERYGAGAVLVRAPLVERK